VGEETPAAALGRAERALGEFAILGIATNIPLLRALVRHPEVRAGRIDTGLLDRLLPSLLPSPATVPTAVAAVAAARAAQPAAAPMAGASAAQRHDPWAVVQGWRP
jgi:acetyl-CoA/propionyl-CoA carboxylase, biotin carboxylase, biotin carboxyl carrier protein